ncbi:TIGR03943 family protein [Actinokineospora auranticolor]|uniref:Putative repeat protein (TIGR03943 family) n=1 Tax=Actinokineospora auranticolor TaxID=155976 RepID=A0A2S6GV63_9PSEU|nr:TIGR03943 family protein [Actinokineospora auranticolor]PPK69135.1 putative repeat protein (TIGR03943 family) [Actinokineospora auranticolor]
MRRETQNILLILAGGALLKISFTGAYLLYVKPAHQPWLIGGGAVMLLLAAVSIARDVFKRPTPAAAASQPDESSPDTHDHSHDDEHDGHNHTARSAWLLLVPVLTIFLIAPPALGADAVANGDNRAAVTRSSGAADKILFSPLAPGDPVALTMSDFAARAAWDSGNSLDGREVRLTAFIVNQGPTTYLARLSIACCAADVLPVRVRLDTPPEQALANDTWVEVTGHVQPGSATEATEYVPTLIPTGFTPITQPENPYE